MLPNGSTDVYNQTEFLHDFYHHLHSLRKNIAILIIIFTILGNALVLVATWIEKSLHQPNKYFIACLAVADLLVGLFVAPLWLYHHSDYYNFHQPIESIHLCRFMVWIDTLTLTASIYTLTFISIDRYLKISKPLQYHSRMTTSRSVKVIFVIWFVSIAVATFTATPFSRSSGIFLTAENCYMLEDTKEFNTFFTVGIFFLPATVIVIMYIRIGRVVYKRKAMLRNGELGENLNDQNQQSAFFQDLKAIRMLLIVVGVFLLCWAPYFVWVLLIFYYPEALEYGDEDSLSRVYLVEISTLIIVTLPLFNSLCNPIIYGCLDQKYGEAFTKLFRQLVSRGNSRRRQPPLAT
jgi:hypothetical protein